jgi:hypothetical protein
MIHETNLLNINIKKEYFEKIQFDFIIIRIHIIIFKIF